MKEVYAITLLLLLFTPYLASSSSEDQTLPEVEIQFPHFYTVNISGTMVKNIGAVGIQYVGRINITNFDKIDKRSLDDTFLYFTFDKLYSEFNYSGIRTYIYNGSAVDESAFSDSISLSKCKVCGFYDFNIAFLQIGTYGVSWRINASGKMSYPEGSIISIVSPIEYENLINQKAVTDSQIKASEAAKDTAEATRKLFYATLGLFLITLILGYFTHKSSKETAKAIEEIAKAAKEISKSNIIETTPSVSYDIISGKKHFESQIKEEISEDKKLKYIYDTRFLINNHTKFGSKSYVNLNLKVDGKPIEIHPLYAGKQIWPIGPFSGIHGHFSIIDVLNKAGKTIKQMKEERETLENWKQQLTMEIEVKTLTREGEPISNPITHWSLDFKEDMWFYTDFNFYK